MEINRMSEKKDFETLMKEMQRKIEYDEEAEKILKH